MNKLLTAASELQDFCQQQGWQMCVIGGLAVQRWGKPRTTQDVDVSLLTGFDREAEFVDPLIQAFSTRLADARQFALNSRVLLLRASNRVPMDISLAALPFEKHMIARATPFKFSSDCSLRTASAEDLVTMKAYADRPQDWIDVEGILKRQSKRLDWTFIFNELSTLDEPEEVSEIIQRLRQLRDNIQSP